MTGDGGRPGRVPFDVVAAVGVLDPATCPCPPPGGGTCRAPGRGAGPGRVARTWTDLLPGSLVGRPGA
ncbi:hypothetical protein FVA95_23395 [Pseudonocardia sp. EV170527-09]|uniref:hypothetical protein n=1 Tax=Pseudonocardia sp. EV170527-09 TaxID=2603411 RepID=UPI0011F28D22|nr:hypothetical protein [Pseudonocardia sp. EV170527-09]KAA1019053.1 hypothetical protein FVA95_23395 [Pseudonocardia sp. EV170527-09]